MADDLVHANTKQRGVKPALLECGTPRNGALVTGDPSKVTCTKCGGGSDE